MTPDPQREYDIMLLITGDVLQAQIARAKARRETETRRCPNHNSALVVQPYGLKCAFCQYVEYNTCLGCGDEITSDDETIDEMHRQCAEADAEIGYKETDD